MHLGVFFSLSLGAMGQPLAAGIDSTCSAAAMPQACGISESHAGEYCAGFQAGAHLTKRAWRAIGQRCEKMEFLQGRVLNSLGRYRLPEDHHPGTLCRRSGYGAGVTSFLASLDRRCETSCEAMGKRIGEVKAREYCLLWMILGGKDDADTYVSMPKTTVCAGGGFEKVCSASWDAVTQSYQRGSLPEQRCATFTQNGQVDSKGKAIGDFAQRNQQARQKACGVASH